MKDPRTGKLQHEQCSMGTLSRTEFAVVWSLCLLYIVYQCSVVFCACKALIVKGDEKKRSINLISM